MTRKLVAIVAICGGGLIAVSRHNVSSQHVVSPFGKAFHGHPTVASWYSAIHGRHTFKCEDMSPTHEHYGCKECPVGPPDRVITFPHGEYRDVPIQVNAYFACMDINMLIPEPSSLHDSDEFYCSREPEDGSIVLDGWKIPCAGGKAEKVEKPR